MTAPGTRYRYLETIREYAIDRLYDAGETTAVARSHAEWYAGFAQRLGENVWSAEEPVWLSRANDEFDNLRGAVSYALEEAAAELLVRLVAPLGRIAHLQRHELGNLETSVAETIRGLEYNLDAHARAVAVFNLSAFRFWQGDFQTARTLALDAVALADTVANKTFGRATLLYYTNLDNAHNAHADAVAAEIARAAGNMFALRTA